MNAYIRNTLFITSALMISACSSTGHQNQSIIDGYTEQLLDVEANHYRISYEGSQWVNKSEAEAQKVIDYSLLRSAELSLEKGFPFFVILQNDSETREIIKDDPICNLKESDAIDERKCMRYKSIGDLTSAFIEEPPEVWSGNNLIKDGDFKDKALFSSISVYKVITRKYNMNRGFNRFQQEGNRVTSIDNWHEVMNDLERPNPNSGSAP